MHISQHMFVRYTRKPMCIAFEKELYQKTVVVTHSVRYVVKNENGGVGGQAKRFSKMNPGRPRVAVQGGDRVAKDLSEFVP